MTEENDIKLLVDHSRELRERYLNDPYRPGYHFVVPEGCHSPVDPNGALFWNGLYHLCYIYQDDGKHYWGHISSVDMVHWRHHPPALGPGDGDDGIFSGGAFIDENGVATISYWGLRSTDGICIATSTDPDLNFWVKNPQNPVIPSTKWGYAEIPAADGGEPTYYGTADPSQIWHHDGRYYMLTGNLLVLREIGEKENKPEHMGDTLYLFVSDDMTNWTYLHEFYKSKREWTRDFEDDMCPDFFQLPASADGGNMSDKHMILFISHTLGCQYYIGDYNNDYYTPDKHGRMTWVDNEFFAPESLLDDRGRRIMWSWIFDRREQATKETSGWSGELSLPRLLWLGEDGTLRMRPVPEMESLRYNAVTQENITVAANSTKAVEKISGNSLELFIEILPGAASKCGIKLCCSPDGDEETLVYYDAVTQTLNVDTSKSSLGEGTKAIESAPFELQTGDTLQLRIFIDKSVVEVFANDRQAIARHIYPTRTDSTGIAIFAEGGDIHVVKLNSWQMIPSNPW